MLFAGLVPGEVLEEQKCGWKFLVTKSLNASRMDYILRLVAVTDLCIHLLPLAERSVPYVEGKAVYSTAH